VASVFPEVHAATAYHRFDRSKQHPKFEKFFCEHIRKLLRIRKGNRNVSKGNYNVAPIECLAKLFPDARFVIAIRHPFTHIHSLVRQHHLFREYARTDARVPKYLAAAGHYEFGPQRVPIRFCATQGDRILDAWSRGDEYLGYAIQRAEVYRQVDSLRASDTHLADIIHVVRYEDLCAQPEDRCARSVITSPLTQAALRQSLRKSLLRFRSRGAILE
jgi:Sulfotransferase family